MVFVQATLRPTKSNEDSCVDTHMPVAVDAPPRAQPRSPPNVQMPYDPREANLVEHGSFHHRGRGVDSLPPEALHPRVHRSARSGISPAAAAASDAAHEALDGSYRSGYSSRHAARPGGHGQAPTSHNFQSMQASLMPQQSAGPRVDDGAEAWHDRPHGDSPEYSQTRPFPPAGHGGSGSGDHGDDSVNGRNGVGGPRDPEAGTVPYNAGGRNGYRHSLTPDTAPDRRKREHSSRGW